MARAQADADLAELRRRIARLEGRPVRLLPAEKGDTASLPNGGSAQPEGHGEAVHAIGLKAEMGPLRRFDAGFPDELGNALTGTGLEAGLACGALHEIACDETRQAGAAVGFAIALLTRLARTRSGSLLWVSDRGVPAEAGALHADGLAQFGLDPDRVIQVRTHTPADTLWALEEGAGCRGLIGVVGEFLQAPRVLDLTASRRLALRTQQGGVTAFVLNHAGPATPSAATTRWRVTGRPGGEEEPPRSKVWPGPGSGPDLGPDVMSGFKGLGRPAWRVRLERNREGRPSTFDLEWDCDERIFRPATHPEPVAAETGDGPDCPQGGAGGGELVRLRFGSGRRFG